MVWIVLATEDQLSEQIGARLAAEAGLEIGQRLRKSGSGYLQSRIANFCHLAQRQPVFLITDLDRVACAPALLGKWFGRKVRPADFVFRVAVREVEAWLLADHEAMRSLLGPKIAKLPSVPDDLADPKKTLLTLARRGPRGVREDLVAAEGAIASQGLGYNARLCQLVREVWHPGRAAERSPSLSKARRRLVEMASQHP